MCGHCLFTEDKNHRMLRVGVYNLLLKLKGLHSISKWIDILVSCVLRQLLICLASGCLCFRFSAWMRYCPERCCTNRWSWPLLDVDSLTQWGQKLEWLEGRQPQKGAAGKALPRLEWALLFLHQFANLRFHLYLGFIFSVLNFQIIILITLASLWLFCMCAACLVVSNTWQPPGL